MKLSNSGLSKYLQCPRSYKLHYKNRLRSYYKGSALFFGGAIDQGLNEILAGKGIEKAKEVFIATWAVGNGNDNKPIDIKTSPFILYSDADFDIDLLTKQDFAVIHEYYESIRPNISSSVYDVINYVKSEKKIAGNVHSINREILSYYNLINWCVLKNKGQMMIEAYAAQIMPLFKRVVAVQLDAALDSNCGDSIGGIIDLVVELQDGTIAIIDNKTSAWDYGVDSVKISQQLTIYKIILNNLYNDGKNDYKVDKCGYAVIKKKPIKIVDKVCKSCGHVGTGRHDTCDSLLPVEGSKPKRCNGEWDKKISISFETQFIVDDITEIQEDIVFETINTATQMINQEFFVPNMNNCITNFGKCTFFDYCHYNKTSDLIDLNKEEENVKN